MFRRPPVMADWLLERLGYTRQNEPLAGDLLEEFRSGRSAGWYWRQTLGVIAHGCARHVVLLAPYLWTLGAGYAAQFSLSYALWSHGFPREAAGSGWVKAGLYVLMQLAGGLASGLVVSVAKAWLLGQSKARLGPMFRAAGSDRRQRSRILAVACYESFSFGFWSYCLCAVVFPRFSRAEFVTFESFWFVSWVFAPAVLPGWAARQRGNQ